MSQNYATQENVQITCGCLTMLASFALVVAIVVTAAHFILKFW